MIEKHFIIATAGHVDHGKSTLVKALTGTDPDRLPEEKARKITIDLGFAELNLTAGDGTRLHLGIVDVPGHEDFVRNMVAGVGAIDLALLVIAADDGWMPQTEEHLQILIYLGVTRAVVALTKTDVADPENAEKQVRERLARTPFADAGIVRIAIPPTLTGEHAIANRGLEQLKEALASALAEALAPKDNGKPRLAVDRVFGLRGIGTVVTGTLIDGVLRSGDTVVVHPRGTQARIRSLQSHGRDVAFARPGTRTAINLPDLTANTQIARGEVITLQDFHPILTIDAILTRLERGQRSLLKSGTSCYLHHGTTRVLAKVVLMDGDSLPTGKVALAQLRLASPLMAFAGDHFILRDGSEKQTIAGGVILDLDAAREHFRSAKRRVALCARAAAGADPKPWLSTEVERTGFAQRATLLRQSRFSELEISAALEELEQAGAVTLRGGFVAEIGLWRSLRDDASKLIATAHQARPESAGLELSELRSQFDSLPSELFDEVVTDLCHDGFVCRGSKIGCQSHRPELPDDLRPIEAAIRKLMSAKPFDPPSRKLIAGDQKSQKVVRFLIERGELVEVGTDTIFSQSVFADMKEAIGNFISRNGPATVSQLRQTLETSRRTLVPMLEHLDRIGFTERVGDQRKLKNKAVTASAHGLS